MGIILEILALLLNVAFFIMIVHIIMSWLINFNVLNVRQPLVYQIWSGLNRLLEPVYEPVRRVLPDTRPLDLAPLVVFIGIIIARDIIIPRLYFAL
ncbi:Integral membrane protein YggT [Candidatus Rhodobacter oscarellae]|uniref:Integral membrane protein YggT n=1 Tax=Candidatus Rhodobacter oscarellae TaxID=1675527 RepID=A0A0J9E8C8_9RHOB|nr:YggT family protein [Candidatus Rhodobacter lobularis]KMW58987.1 Integral membrane protein YggT [Candidatus Rhodobacter lobularis]